MSDEFVATTVLYTTLALGLTRHLPRSERVLEVVLQLPSQVSWLPAPLKRQRPLKAH